jgi:hypothetical protein
MNVWTVHNAHTGEQIGPACFSLDEARNRIDDLLAGRKRIWMGFTRFRPKPLT